jgi:photosystem II stability/assembly factor-like uncharacterized protein
VTAIAAGTQHNLALKEDGTVVAWGRDDYGQATVPAGLSGVTAVAAGYGHSLALKGDGTVVAWGWNESGQATVPAALSGVTAMAGGGAHSLALKEDGTVVAWGDNRWGQRAVPHGLSGVSAIAAGGMHSLALSVPATGPTYEVHLPIVAQRGMSAVGWAVGDSVDGYGTIIHTTDGGQTWLRQGKVGEIPDVNLERVSAIDAHNAWVVGGQGTILRTHDGGRSWQRQQVPSGASESELGGIRAIDGQTAWAAGTPGVILHTSDGGQTWTQQGQGTVPPAHLEGVYASDADHAWTVGGVTDQSREKKVILRTIDGGTTWELVPWVWPGAHETGHFIDIHGVDANTVWTVGTAMVLHTADGGRTWVDQTMEFGGYFDANGVFAVDRNTVWVVTDSGGIYRSDDGGKDWVTQHVPHSVRGDYIMRISAVDKQTAWAVSVPMPEYPPPPGHVLHTADGGQTWTIQVEATPVKTSWNGVSFVR